MLSYCGNNTNFTDVWIDKGINHCFLDTISASILFTFMFVCGCIQCAVFRRHSTKVDKSKIKHGSLAFSFQVLFTSVLILEATIHVVMQDVSIQPLGVRGFEILNAVALVLAWTGSCRLLFLERNKALPTIPTRGHGLVLLMFWTFAVIKESVAFVSWPSSYWWWSLET